MSDNALAIIAQAATQLAIASCDNPADKEKLAELWSFFFDEVAKKTKSDKPGTLKVGPWSK